MEITQTIVTKKGMKETATARYEVEYGIVDSKLSHVQMNILSKETEKSSATHLGSFFAQGETVTCTLPAGSTLMPFVEDYEKILVFIDRDIQEKSGDDSGSVEV